MDSVEWDLRNAVDCFFIVPINIQIISKWFDFFYQLLQGMWLLHTKKNKSSQEKGTFAIICPAHLDKALVERQVVSDAVAPTAVGWLEVSKVLQDPRVDVA